MTVQYSAYEELFSDHLWFSLMKQDSFLWRVVFKTIEVCRKAVISNKTEQPHRLSSWFALVPPPLQNYVFPDFISNCLLFIFLPITIMALFVPGSGRDMSHFGTLSAALFPNIPTCERTHCNTIHLFWDDIYQHWYSFSTTQVQVKEYCGWE